MSISSSGEKAAPWVSYYPMTLAQGRLGRGSCGKTHRQRPPRRTARWCDGESYPRAASPRCRSPSSRASCTARRPRSTSTAPSKESLVLLAIRRWGETTLEGLEARAASCSDAATRARTYFRGGAESLRMFSVAFFRDVVRFEFDKRRVACGCGGPLHRPLRGTGGACPRGGDT